MELSERTLAVIGCGMMGEAILRGLFRAGKLSPSQVVATTRRPEAQKSLSERFGVRAGGDNLAAARLADPVLVAVKPQQVHGVLTAPGMQDALRGKLVICIAAGIRLEQLRAWLPESAVVRAMPNTPCLIDEGMTIIARGPGVSDEQAALARSLFEDVGECLELDDKHMDAVTSLNSSGPAFAYVILEALADGGVMMGLRRDVAVRIVARMFQGSARMILETGLHPAALKDQVTTPAGCTIAGLLTLEDGRIRSVLARAVEETTRVAGKLGQD